MLSSFIHRSSVTIAFKQGCFTPLTWWSWVLLKCYWEMTWLISRITVMVFDLVHHKGNILFIFSVKGFNHPQSMMEVIRIMWFFFFFSRGIHDHGKENFNTCNLLPWKHLPLAYDVAKPGSWSTLHVRKQCAVLQALPDTLAKFTGKCCTLCKSQVLKDITLRWGKWVTDLSIGEAFLHVSPYVSAAQRHRGRQVSL